MKGCKFDCRYCRPSFQAKSKRQKHRFEKCYSFVPHEHPERLTASLPRTNEGEFIAVCLSGDISFCTKDYLKQIVARIKEYPGRTFLVQSKNPATFARIPAWPSNVMLGITLETDRDDGYGQISKAPVPSQRFKDFLGIKDARKTVTIEPVMEFDLDRLFGWIQELKPEVVWIGYDSKRSSLSEPPLEKVQAMISRLERTGIEVRLKTIREGRPQA